MYIVKRMPFDPETFNWSPDARKTVDIVQSAGRMDRLTKFLQKWCRGLDVTESEINSMVSLNRRRILYECGVNEDGSPRNTRNFKVFMRVEGVISDDVMAETPEEAARIAYVNLNGGDPIIPIDRSDVDVMRPVAYDEGDGDTKDYPEDLDLREWEDLCI